MARIWNIDRSENCKTVANQPGQKEGMQLEWVAVMMIMIIMKIKRRFSITHQHTLVHLQLILLCHYHWQKHITTQHWPGPKNQTARGLWCSFAFNNSGVHAAHSRAVAFTRGRSRERIDSLWEIAGFHFPLFSKDWSSTWSHHMDCNAYMDMILLLVMIIQFSSSFKNAKHPAIPTFQHSSSNTLKNTLRQIQRSPHLWTDQKYYSVYIYFPLVFFQKSVQTGLQELRGKLRK